MKCCKFNPSLLPVPTVASQNSRVIVLRLLFHLGQFLVFNNCHGINHCVISFSGSGRAVKNGVQANVCCGFLSGIRTGVRCGSLPVSSLKLLFRHIYASKEYNVCRKKMVCLILIAVIV